MMEIVRQTWILMNEADGDVGDAQKLPDIRVSHRYEIVMRQINNKHYYSLRDRHQTWFQWLLSLWSIFTISITIYIVSTLRDQLDVDYNGVEWILFFLLLIVFLFSFGSSLIILAIIAIVPLLGKKSELIITDNRISTEQGQLEVKDTLKISEQTVNGIFQIRIDDGLKSIEVFNHDHNTSTACYVYRKLKQQLESQHNFEMVN